MKKKFKTVYVPGTWDLFHMGHVKLLERAKKIAAKVIAGVDTDDSVYRDKGKSPIMTWKERLMLVSACRHVDKVTWNKHTIPSTRRLKLLKVEAVVLGSDWKKKPLQGREEAQKKGIKIIYFPYTKRISTTKIKRKVRF